MLTGTVFDLKTNISTYFISIIYAHALPFSLQLPIIQTITAAHFRLAYFRLTIIYFTPKPLYGINRIHYVR